MKPRLLFALVCFAVFLTYLNSFSNGFHFDDYHAVVDNPYVRSLHNVGRFFTDGSTFSVLRANQTYRPVVSTSLALDYALGGGYSPRWFHVTTFVVFLAQLGAMFALFAVILRKRWVAPFATAWYGLHPAIAETINYVIQRADVYSTAGVVGALAIYARAPQRRRWGVYLVPLALALLSKPPAAVFPLLLFAYVWFFEEDLRPERLRAALSAALPSLALCVAALLLAHALTPKTFAPTSLAFGPYVLSQPYVLLRYFIAFFLPVHLSADSDLQPVGLDAPMVLGLAFVGALGYAVWWTARRRELRPISFGLLWFMVASLPTSVYPLAELENDHRMFFPFVGLVLAVSWAGALAVERVAQRRAVAIAAVALLCAYGYGTHVRNEVWRTDASLWYDVTQKSPHNGRGLMNYGLSQMRAGDYAGALASFERAASFTPNYANLEINLGIASGGLHRDGDAERHFRRAIALAPGEDAPHYYYARWLHQIGRSRASLDEAAVAVSLNPAVVVARALLMQDDMEEGRRAQAREVALGTLRLDPDDPDARRIAAEPPAGDAPYWLGVSFHQFGEGDYDACIASARQALRLRPKYAEAYNNIAAADQAEHRWDEAIAASRQALRLKPDFHLAKNNLAWSLEQKRKAAR